MGSGFRKKRPLSIMALVLGVALFATAAFADLTAGSPYGEFKQAIKQSVSMLGSSSWSNYTETTLISFSLDGQLKNREEHVRRHDAEHQLYESQSIHWSEGEEHSYLEYTDGVKDQLIEKSSDSDIWFVYEDYPAANRYDSILTSDPFEEDPRAEDIERIVDAALGNLTSLVQMELNTDGSKRFHGSVINAQLPTLVQALSSFYASSSGALGYAQSNTHLREFQIEQISGEAWQNTSGLLHKVEASLRFSGTDSEGVVHAGLIEIGLDIDQIGTTTVTLPDLSGLKVETHPYYGRPYALDDESAVAVPLLASKDFGHYRSNVYRLGADGWELYGAKDIYFSENGDSIDVRYTERYNDRDEEFLCTFTMSNQSDSYRDSRSIDIETADDGYLYGNINGVYLPGILDIWIDSSLSHQVQTGRELQQTEWVMVFDD